MSLFLFLLSLLLFKKLVLHQNIYKIKFYIFYESIVNLELSMFWLVHHKPWVIRTLSKRDSEYVFNC